MLVPSDTHNLSRLDQLGISASSPEVALQRPLEQLVQATLDAAAKGPNSARAYQTAIGQFVVYLDQERGDLLPERWQAEWRPLAVSARDGKQTVWRFNAPSAVLRLVDASLLDGYRAFLAREGAQPNAIVQRVAIARTFLAVAYRERVLTDDQARALDIKPYRPRLKRDDKPVGRRLTPDEVRALRAAVNINTVKGKRDLAIIDAMLFAGLRRDEAASLCLEDFRQDRGHWWLVLMGKGQKTRRIRLHDLLSLSLNDWLGTTGRGLGQSGVVYLSVNKGDKWGERTINASVVGRLVAEYGAKAGLAPLSGLNRLSPHDLRRTCARNAFDNGAPLPYIRDLLGHRSIETTMRYIGATDDDLRTAVDYVNY
ncbi:MAG: site-specific integrase [Anaerolineae bacterium]|nr:site-specific integrase [Anaerolineae bacterium]